MKNKKKLILGVLAAVALMTVVAYANGSLFRTLDHILPGEVVQGLGIPKSSIQIGGKELRYREARKVDITDAMSVQNGKVSDIRYVYLAEDGDIYTVDNNYQLLSFSSVEPLSEKEPSPGTEVSQAAIDAAIAGAAALDIQLTQDRLDSLGRAEYGWQFNFKSGKDPRVEDYVMITLDWENNLSSLILDNSGIDSMDEVNAEFFDDAFEKYCQSLKVRPKEITITYKRYGDTIVARYSLTFEDDGGARWADIVSFAEKS